MTEPTPGIPALTLVAEALFCSDLQPSDHPSHEQIRGAVGAILAAADRGAHCIYRVARAYGEHPELAAARMRWCLDAAQAVYPVLDGEGEQR